MREQYGDTQHGRQLLITRRLLERGVRFVQVWSGAGQPWDNHNDLEKQHRQLAADWDGPIAAFLADLKARAVGQHVGDVGRRVRPHAGGRAAGAQRPRPQPLRLFDVAGRRRRRGGYVHGATDEFGFAAVENKVHVHDLHATVLHLLGFDHTKLTYRYAGRDFRLTDVQGRVVKELLG